MQFSLILKLSQHHNPTVFSSFMSHSYILALRRCSSYATSTDSYLGHWLFTTLRNVDCNELARLRANLPPQPPHVHISACYCFPRWYPTAATCPAHMRRDQRLRLWTTAHRNLNRKWNQDHTDALWLVEERLWRPYAVITVVVTFQMGCYSTKDMTLTPFKENLSQSNGDAFFSRYKQSETGRILSQKRHDNMDSDTM